MEFGRSEKFKRFQVHTIIQKSKENMKKWKVYQEFVPLQHTYLGKSQNFSDEKKFAEYL